METLPRNDECLPLRAVKTADATGRLIALTQGKVMRVAGQKSVCLHCLKGGVWITQEQDSRDYLLTAGQAWTFCRSGDIVVQALTDSLLAWKSLPVIATEEVAQARHQRQNHLVLWETQQPADTDSRPLPHQTKGEEVKVGLYDLAVAFLLLASVAAIVVCFVQAN